MTMTNGFRLGAGPFSRNPFLDHGLKVENLTLKSWSKTPFLTLIKVNFAKNFTLIK
jgi:hypothetical protein